MELFDDLLPFYWREVEVPVRSFRMSIAHDLVQHKPWGVNGARVEDTGLAPVRFQVTIPFVNHIAPGKNEGWLSAELYPTVFREFVLAFQNRKAGHLQHPEFGLIACKPETMEVTWVGTQRSGVEVEATFVEALDDEVQHKVRNGLIELDVAAVSFDVSRADLKRLVPQLPTFQGSFADLARAIQGIGDAIALMQHRAGGQLQTILYRVDNIQRSIDRVRSPFTWAATRDLEMMRDAVHELKDKLLVQRRGVFIHITRDDTTIAALIPQLPGAKLADVMKLNPQLISTPFVPAGTRVRYYAPRAA